MPSNEKEQVVFTQPKTFDERAGVAKKCCEKLKLSMPCVVDTLDNAVDNAYAGWPERIFIVDTAGKIAYVGNQGPWGFKPEEAEAWLKANLPSGESPTSSAGPIEEGDFNSIEASSVRFGTGNWLMSITPRSEAFLETDDGARTFGLTSEQLTRIRSALRDCRFGDLQKRYGSLSAACLAHPRITVVTNGESKTTTVFSLRHLADPGERAEVKRFIELWLAVTAPLGELPGPDEPKLDEMLAFVP